VFVKSHESKVFQLPKNMKIFQFQVSLKNFCMVIFYWKEKTERNKLLPALGMSTKMAANGNQTHFRTNQRCALEKSYDFFYIGKILW